MAVCDVETEAQYLEVIEYQTNPLREAQKRRGQRPHDRISRDVTYSRFMENLKLLENTNTADVVNWSFVDRDQKSPAGDTPSGNLSSAPIYNPPSRIMAAIWAVMEDNNRDVLKVHLYQQEDEMKCAATDIVSIGTILLIKEPFFKITGDGEYVLRVDHLSDVIHIRGDDARIPKAWKQRLIENEYSAESLKAKGNLSMKKRRYWDAITEYSDALNHPATADQIEIIRRNRSLAFLKTNQFDAALSDSGFPNFSSNPNEKAIFRAAEALYSLEKSSDSCRVLELLLSNFSNHSEASMALDRAQSRSLEQTTGIYNFEQLQAEAKQLRPPHLDHATYIGPVEIRQTESKGRGLFLTKPVKAGDLLLCEKAFGHIYAEKGADGGNGSGAKFSMVIDPGTKQTRLGVQPDLVKLIVQKLYRNPSLAPAFTTLYHGTYEGVSTRKVDGEPIVDTFLVESIVSFNSFSGSFSSLNSHSEARGQQFPQQSNPMERNPYQSSGIWTHASYINHCCIPNARRSCVGNLMIVRASRDMEAGTEITFWYHKPDGSTEDWDEMFKHWGFVCRCALCLDTKATKAVVSTKREELLKDLTRAFDSPAVCKTENELEKMERLLDALNQTYTQPVEAVPRLLLWKPTHVLTQTYVALENASKSMEWAVKVLTSLGFVVTGADASQTRFTIVKWGMPLDNLVQTLLNIRTAFTAMGSREDSERAGEYAKTMYKIIVGEDESFHASYESEENAVAK